jgi:hypothetical protein
MKAFHSLTCTMGAISLIGDTSKRAEDLPAGTWGSIKGGKASDQTTQDVALLSSLSFFATRSGTKTLAPDADMGIKLA